MVGYGGGMFSNGGYNFTTLVALILIVLTFGNKKGTGTADGSGNGQRMIDKSILFIIAFFFLACGCGRGSFGRY